MYSPKKNEYLNTQKVMYNSVRKSFIHNRPKMPATQIFINRRGNIQIVVCIHAMEYYKTMKKNYYTYNMPESQSERRLTEKNTQCVILLI